MTTCKHCEHRLWFWQRKTAEGTAHASCERTSVLFDQTIERMQAAGKFPSNAQLRKLRAANKRRVV